jgi:hypothetical protein
MKLSILASEPKWARIIGEEFLPTGDPWLSNGDAIFLHENQIQIRGFILKGNVLKRNQIFTDWDKFVAIHRIGGISRRILFSRGD